MALRYQLHPDLGITYHPLHRVWLLEGVEKQTWEVGRGVVSLLTQYQSAQSLESTKGQRRKILDQFVEAKVLVPSKQRLPPDAFPKNYRAHRLVYWRPRSKVYEAFAPSGKSIILQWRMRDRRTSQITPIFQHDRFPKLISLTKTKRGEWLAYKKIPGVRLDLGAAKKLKTKKRVFQFVGRLLDLVESLHEQGIVHGDLHPGNVLCDRFDFPALLDFELAHYEDDLTKQIHISGAPEFAAPEVIAKIACTRASDIYALAKIAYFALRENGLNPPEYLERFVSPEPSMRPSLRVLARALTFEKHN